MARPLEFAEADEARAASMGGYLAWAYGTHVTEPCAAKPEPVKVAKRCPSCRKVREWASNHRECPKCRGAKLKGRVRGHRSEMVPVSIAMLDELLAGRNKALASVAIGRNEGYLGKCGRRGTMERSRLEALRELVAG